jgi:orotate phosphoribosyltransferase
MKFPEKYIKKGKFKLHSGDESNIFYDVNELITDDYYFEYILRNVPSSAHYIGIATGGAIIAREISRIKNSKCSFIKDNELKGERPKEKWVLIDDVTTTGSSLENAIEIIGKNPSQIIVAVDRRFQNKNPKVYSIFGV